ncbi:MAG TPA: 3-hydroxybutyryl-CoA dehydrogenase [Polyangiaceae bacterium]|nr:3-hydroxybutyryl-CoA dehydrogenase [Polyangiaceae bacterium]
MKLEDIRCVGVIGAGQMGRGIAQVAAGAGYQVLMSDVDQTTAEQGKAAIEKQLTRQVDKGRMTEDDKTGLLERLVAVGDLKRMAEAQIAIEAATESFDLKLKIFAAVDAALPEGAILASNTSSISITKLAAATSRPSRVMGMHFMNPVPVMKLCELVKGVQTSPATYDAVKGLALKLGKTVITSEDHPGFLVNRILIPLLNEACFALQEGVASPEDIDTGAKLGLNHPMGPLELSDLIGLDTVLAIAEVLYREIGDPKYRPPTMLRNYVAAGWLGRKTGRGFYRYDERGKKVEEGT